MAHEVLIWFTVIFILVSEFSNWVGWFVSEADFCIVSHNPTLVTFDFPCWAMFLSFRMRRMRVWSTSSTRISLCLGGLVTLIVLRYFCWCLVVFSWCCILWSFVIRLYAHGFCWVCTSQWWLVLDGGLECFSVLYYCYLLLLQDSVGMKFLLKYQFEGLCLQSLV